MQRLLLFGSIIFFETFRTHILDFRWISHRAQKLQGAVA